MSAQLHAHISARKSVLRTVYVGQLRPWRSSRLTPWFGDSKAHVIPSVCSQDYISVSDQLPLSLCQTSNLGERWGSFALPRNFKWLVLRYLLIREQQRSWNIKVFKDRTTRRRNELLWKEKSQSKVTSQKFPYYFAS